MDSGLEIQSIVGQARYRWDQVLKARIELHNLRTRAVFRQSADVV